MLGRITTPEHTSVCRAPQHRMKTIDPWEPTVASNYLSTHNSILVLLGSVHLAQLSLTTTGAWPGQWGKLKGLHGCGGHLYQLLH